MHVCPPCVCKCLNVPFNTKYQLIDTYNLLIQCSDINFITPCVDYIQNTRQTTVVTLVAMVCVSGYYGNSRVTSLWLCDCFVAVSERLA